MPYCRGRGQGGEQGMALRQVFRSQQITLPQPCTTWTRGAQDELAPHPSADGTAQPWCAHVHQAACRPCSWDQASQCRPTAEKAWQHGSEQELRCLWAGGGWRNTTDSTNEEQGMGRAPRLSRDTELSFPTGGSVSPTGSHTCGRWIKIFSNISAFCLFWFCCFLHN